MHNEKRVVSVKSILDHIPTYIPSTVDPSERTLLLEKVKEYDWPIDFHLNTKINYDCLVTSWQIMEIYSDEKICDVLYSSHVIQDRKGRFSPGSYVSTSAIQHFDTEKKLVQTNNTLYALDGPGRRVHAQLEEGIIIKYLGISLQEIRLELTLQIETFGHIKPDKLSFGFPWKIQHDNMKPFSRPDRPT